MAVKFVKCPDCLDYIAVDDQYCCTLCWGEGVVTIEEYEQYTGENYEGAFYDESGRLFDENLFGVEADPEEI